MWNNALYLWICTKNWRACWTAIPIPNSKQRSATPPPPRFPIYECPGEKVSRDYIFYCLDSFSYISKYTADKSSTSDHPPGFQDMRIEGKNSAKVRVIFTLSIDIYSWNLLYKGYIYQPPPHTPCIQCRSALDKPLLGVNDIQFLLIFVYIKVYT